MSGEKSLAGRSKERCLFLQAMIIIIMIIIIIIIIIIITIILL